LPYVIANPSTCRLSVICNVGAIHPTQRVEVFANIFGLSNSLETPAVCVKKIFKENQGVLADTKVKWKKWCEKSFLFQQYLALFWK